MDKLDYVAVYAAVVSTIVLFWDIYKWKTAGASIRYEVQTGMRSFNIPEYEGLKLITCTVTNTGDRSTTITHWGYLYFPNWWSQIRKRNSKAAILPNPSLAQPIPFELKPGAQWHGVGFQDDEIEELARKGRLYFLLYTSHAKKGFKRRVQLKPEASPNQDGENS